MLRTAQLARPAIAAIALLAAAAGLGGCATPTLPLPPPAALSLSAPDNMGMITVSGEVLPEAWVYVVNLDTEEGVIDRADVDGRFSVRLAAEVGHYISVVQQSGADRGPPREAPVPAP